MRAKAYIDGSGNSSRIQACAVSLELDDGSLHERTQLLPGGTTNNVGEYSGLLLAIRLAKELGVEEILIRSDSKLIVEQILGNWKCKESQLIPLRNQAWEEAKTFRQIEIEWIPREWNARADELCRIAIKEAMKNANQNPFAKSTE